MHHAPHTEPAYLQAIRTVIRFCGGRNLREGARERRGTQGRARGIGEPLGDSVAGGHRGRIQGGALEAQRRLEGGGSSAELGDLAGGVSPSPLRQGQRAPRC